jgi:hypothetical protein
MLVELKKVKFIEILVDLYPVSEEQVNEMVEELREHGQLTPVTVIEDEGEEDYWSINGRRRCLALAKMNATHVNVDIIPCDANDIIKKAILANTQRPKSWVTKGKEVKFLSDYARQHYTELKTEDPEMTRAMKWVAERIGYKSKDQAYKLLKMVEADPIHYALNALDTGEIKSFEKAYKKACNIIDPPKEKKESSPTCAPCTYFRDPNGNICPRHIRFNDNPDEWTGNANEAPSVDPPTQPEGEQPPTESESSREGGNNE